MHKNFTILSLLFLLFSAIADAQNKYALLVGINNYYEKPGVLHPSSLHGCVNDALSIKALLENRFGFDATSIETLFDENATVKNVTDAMHRALQKCKPGDAFVF